jgi:hypothetical protein
MSLREHTHPGAGCLPSATTSHLRIATAKFGSKNPILPLQFVELDEPCSPRASYRGWFNLPVHKVG